MGIFCKGPRGCEEFTKPAYRGALKGFVKVLYTCGGDLMQSLVCKAAIMRRLHTPRHIHISVFFLQTWGYFTKPLGLGGTLHTLNTEGLPEAPSGYEGLALYRGDCKAAIKRELADILTCTHKHILVFYYRYGDVLQSF